MTIGITVTRQDGNTEEDKLQNLVLRQLKALFNMRSIDFRLR